MKKYLSLLCFVLICMSACREMATGPVSLRIRVTAPAEFPDLDFTLIQVKVRHVMEPISHTAYFNAQGEAELMMNPGKYTVTVSTWLPTGYTVSAGTDEFLLTGNGLVALDGTKTAAEIELALDYALSGSIIFREIYYAGSKTPAGVGYFKDQYFELYNNSDEDVYLDSLCIGALAPVNSTVSSNAWAGRDELGLFQMTWMVPGTGRQYPLPPGKSCVIALNAIDHRDRCDSGLDLSRADFGFYDDLLTHEKHPDVTPLRRIFAGQGTAYAISHNSPALVIFRPPMGVSAWLADAAHWQRYQPGQSGGLIYQHIHKSWILDGVDCVASPSRATKRQPVSVDASYTYLHQGQNLGHVVRRKAKTILPDGRIVYEDTNNSAEDFETDVPASPQLNR